MTAPFDFAAGWLQENLLLPLLYALDMMEWEDISFGWALFAVYGVAQVVVTYAVCVPLERWRPVETWPDKRAVAVDVLYTLISRVGLLPLVTFVLFYKIQVTLNGFLTDHGWVPPTLERLIPDLLGHQVLTFFLYVVILDFSDYWRHRLSHVFNWWYSLHAVHHAQRQMTFWSDDRNHLLDDIIAFVWFTVVALLIGIPPMQFPLLVLLLRLLESLSHANARLSFGWLGERLLISPRFHRAHHGVTAAGEKSVNYGAILPWWDMIFRTADFSREFAATGDPTAEEALATGGYVTQQWVGLKRMVRDILGRHPAPRGS
ncbi:sterol desaturase family protein [Limobrevibacterium gyesilva]|uniref:Sterol desaturase family protein n=1 Tax=Limobrevibacterium gyesilva TaxID=2991712 RepID=A0AA42CDQ7_9PROT|nr:sterol desaturase family protein [Limobrevibacterium gyesilva]MCW3475158.1 sterol desaturase family protein [Limobrevibacterium gyesilva]